MNFQKFLLEYKKKEKKIVFVEYDPEQPFPKDTITSLQKEINKNCKDLEKEWRDAIDVMNASFVNLDVPIPQAYQKERWKQYCELIKYAVKNLIDARGLKGDWSLSI